MKEDRLYLVTCGSGNIYACTPEQIDNNNSQGANFKLVKVDEDGRAYLEDKEPDHKELYNLKED